ncbi:hypothetical protein A3850_006355 [Lewinella sp. 4G2]|nr:hypothetical protein A3850_006355 [Lewinella sp. 4G2]
MGWWAFAHAQQPTLTFVNYNTEDGLRNNSINSLAKDQTGYLWLATSRGLYRFDGYRFKEFLHSSTDSTSLPDNSVSVVFADDQDRVWVGTQEGGVALYDRSLDQFTSFNNADRPRKRISHNQITGIDQLSDGTIIVTTAAGYNLFDEGTRTFRMRVEAGGVGLLELSGPALADTLRSIVARSHLPAPARAPNSSRIISGAAPKSEESTYARLVRWSGYVYYDSRQAYASFEKHFTQEETRHLWPLIQPHLEPEVKKNTGLNGYADISALHVDDEDNIFLGYKCGGIGIIKPGASEPEILRHNMRSTTLECEQVNGLYRDGDTLYAGLLRNGLITLDLPTGRESKPAMSSAAATFYGVAGRGEDLYFATTSGLIIYHKKTGSYEQLQRAHNHDWTIIASECAAVLPDEEGVIWVGHYAFGLSKATPAQAIRSNPEPGGEPLPEGMRSASTFLQDAHGNLWVGYFEGGLRKLDATTLEERGLYLIDNANGIRRSSIFTLHEGRDGTLWAGGYDSGLLRYDVAEDTWSVYPNSRAIFGGNDIRSIVEDERGRLYVAVHGVGVTELNPQTGEHRSFPADLGARYTPYIFDLMIDRQDRLWMAGVGGVFRLDAERESIVALIRPSETGSQSFFHRANTIAQSADGNIWVGTQEGLLSLNEAGEHRADLSIPEQLQAHAVLNLQFEGAGGTGRLWMDQEEQLCAFDPTTGAFSLYEPPAHYQATLYRKGASARLGDGDLLFGYNNGLLRFTPTKLAEPGIPATPSITSAELFQTGQQKEFIALAPGETLSLPNDNQGFSLNLSTFYYPQPSAVEYEVRLQPLGGEWQNLTGDAPEYSLYHLPPGEHTVEFRASLASRKAYSDVATLNIEVAAPWYASNWAYALYGFAILLALYGYQRFIKTREALRQSVTIARLKTENTQEMATSKARFFVNVSHELRTPLTLINGPLTELMKPTEPTSGQRQKLYRLMHRNTQRLQRLVDRLLDIQKIENESPDLRFEEGDIVAYLRLLVESFHPRAQSAGVELRESLPEMITRVNYSPEVVDRICTNLLSNAIKFTPEGGTVQFRALILEGESGRELLINVIDDGPGIPKDEQQYLFERFYRGTNGQKIAGSGVGLSIVKQYTEQIGGEVSCLSDVGQGATFKVRLPLHPAVVKANPTIDEETLGQVTIDKVDDQRPHVLIIDDDADVRELLRFGCETTYQVSEAADGLEALERAEALQPDLILTDLMMPGLDGIGVCKAIKENPRTSHLPVILLTARHSDSARTLALEAGANDFLTKPFELDHVLNKIENTLQTLAAARRKWVAEPETLQPEDFPVVDTDVVFLRQLREYVEENMDAPEMSTDALFRHLAVSRSVCYTKVKALTGLPLQAYIKELRIGRARQLLEMTDIPVGEVAFRTGFKTTQHFSRSFKEVAGSSPTKFRAMHRPE